MSQLFVDNIKNRTGGALGLPGGVIVTGIITAKSGIEFGVSGVGGTITADGQAEFAGVVTATSFSGDGSALTNLNIPAGFNELDAALFN